MSRWTCAPVGVSESSQPLAGNLEMMSPNTILGAAPEGVFVETALLDSETGKAKYTLGSKGHPSRAINQ
jgi:hypothetical protein